MALQFCKLHFGTGDEDADDCIVCRNVLSSATASPENVVWVNGYGMTEADKAAHRAMYERYYNATP